MGQLNTLDVEADFYDKNHLERRAMINDLLNALTVLVGDAEHNRELAARFFAKFHAIYTVNFDAFQYLVIDEVAHDRKMTDTESLQLAHYHEILGQIVTSNNGELEPEHSGMASGIMNSVEFRELTKQAQRHERFKRGPILDTRLVVNDAFVRVGDEYIWLGPDPSQTIFYLHGGVHLYPGKQDGKLRKINTILASELETLRHRLEAAGHSFLCVFADNKYTKLNLINKVPYLAECLRSLGEATGNLYCYGLEFALKDNDDHLWEKINENEGLDNIYISIHHDERDPIPLDEKLKIARAKADKILDRHQGRVFFFSTDLGEFTPKNGDSWAAGSR